MAGRRRKKAVVQERKVTAVKERMTKSAMLIEIAAKTDLDKKKVAQVFDELAILIERHIKKRSCANFVMPGLFKITVKKKKARKARKGINPFTGDEMMFKAKPASNAVKITPLKKTKDMVT